MEFPARRAGEIWQRMPESKLELIDGRLVVGSSLSGSRYLLWAMLQTLGPPATLALAPLDRWHEALERAFRAPHHTAPHVLQAWAAEVEYMPPQPQGAGAYFGAHHAVYQHLMFELYQVLHQADSIGMSIQRFVMRLGENALLPDLQCFRRDHLHRLQTYYYNGPASLVIEVMTPDSQQQDAVTKRRLYAQSGVPEYWLIDAVNRRFDVLRLTADGYVLQTPGDDGRIVSVGMPGLVCTPAQLWSAIDQRAAWQDAVSVLAIDAAQITIGKRTPPNDHTDWTWEWSPFTPAIQVSPTAISFDQFLEWCPESKFELLDGRPSIGSWEGTKTTLGMLSMTFGLEEVVRLLQPQVWVDALLSEEANRQQDTARRDMWWGRARQASALLREQFNMGQVAVIGDLLQGAPLNYWSELTLVVPEILREQRHELYVTLDNLPDGPRIDLRFVEDASARQQVALNDAVWL